MNKDAQQELQRILSLPENELTDSDITFLRARSSYLTKSQLRDYAEFLNLDQAALDAMPEEEPKKRNLQYRTKVAPAQPVNPTPTQQEQVAADQAVSQPASQDVRLDLDKPADQATTEPAVEPTQTATPETVAPQATENPAVQAATQDENVCRDPDCTHENHQ